MYHLPEWQTSESILKSSLWIKYDEPRAFTLFWSHMKIWNIHFYFTPALDNDMFDWSFCIIFQLRLYHLPISNTGCTSSPKFPIPRGYFSHSIIWEKGHFILWETGNSILCERFYPLEIGPLILWDSGHPLVNGTWETGHAILWESDHLSSGKHLVGIGNLGDGFHVFEFKKAV